MCVESGYGTIDSDPIQYNMLPLLGVSDKFSGPVVQGRS